MPHASGSRYCRKTRTSGWTSRSYSARKAVGYTFRLMKYVLAENQECV